jgi:hypothetical protein
MAHLMAWKRLTPRQPNRAIAGSPSGKRARRMIDIFTVIVPHALMALAVWRLLPRDDLDQDPHLPVKADLFRQKRPRQAEQPSPPHA